MPRIGVDDRLAAALRSPVGRFAPPVALMGLIFFLSAQPDLNSGLGLVDFIGRKLIHATEFGLLWFLFLRAFGFRRPWVAAAIAVGYAATDEIHQHFVHGRHGTPIDVAIDSVGVVIAWLLYSGARRAGPGRRRDGSEPAALGGDEHGLRAVDRAQLAGDVVQMGADGGRRER
jgi:hypothetical protein